MSKFTSNSNDRSTNLSVKHFSLSTDDETTRPGVSGKQTDEDDINTDDDSHFMPFSKSQDSLVTLDRCDEDETELCHRHFFHREQVNLEPYQLVWCDANVADLTVTISELRKIVDYTKQFDNVEDCMQYMRESNDTVTFLVCSNDVVDCIVPKIHNQTDIRSIYIYCSNQSFDEPLLAHSSKVSDFCEINISLLKTSIH
jgi:hypothetical protein